MQYRNSLKRTHSYNIQPKLMRKFLLCSIFSLLLIYSADAQIKKTLHKTYEIDSVNAISMDLIGEYEVLTWAGSSVLVETSVELYDANINIFKFFLKEGRYKIDLNLDGQTAAFVSHDKVRKTIKTSNGQCWEIVKSKIYIPEEFVIIDETKMVRNPEAGVASERTN